VKQHRHCTTCAIELGKDNKTGFCRVCLRVQRRNEAEARLAAMPDVPAYVPILKVADLVAVASEVFHVHPRDMLGNARFAWLHPSRRAVSYLAKKYGHSYPQIGARLGGRDHSTIIHARKCCQYDMQRDPDFADKVSRVERLALNRRAAERARAGLPADGLAA